jgi:hypothetical protein
MIRAYRAIRLTNEFRLWRAILLSKYAVVTIAVLWGRTPARADACADLAALKLANTTMTAAQTIPADTHSPPAGVPPAALNGLPSFCRVAAEIHPAKDSDIKFEVWMPTSGWNGMLMGRGNGGFAGSIHYSEMSYGVRNGYATVSTDTGHSGDSANADWAVGHPEKVIDFGYRAVHEMTVKAKQIVKTFYAEPPRHSYFDSCSNGGRQALMEAQRFPEDYDGITAGAPANNWTHNVAEFMWNSQALYENPARQIPPSKLPMIHSAVLKACDGQDGVKDGEITDPRACRFDPAVLLCKDAETESCLTAPQIDALKKIYSGMQDSHGRTIYPGLTPGSELGPAGWVAWIDAPTIDQSMQYTLGLAFYRNMVFGDPQWKLQSFTVDRDVRITDKKLAKILNATNPNLKPFADRGGKLILYQGWNDAAIAPLNMVDYYDGVVAAVPVETDSFLRLYMVPGLQHCWGGSGAVDFDVFSSLKRWVETGEAPSSILAKQHQDPADTTSPVVMTRPLCPYPQQARYKGSGDTNSAASFECK